MKKHFLYLSTAALLAMSFASCVDNDEPKGLEYLRYARANKWDADAEYKRATIYGDSLLQVYKAVEQDLKNKAAELDNIRLKAKYDYEIEKEQYRLTVEKAEMDVELAKAKYQLARESEANEKALEQFKADLIAKQLVAKKAQEKLAAFEADAQNRQDSLNAVLKARQAEFKNDLADAQDALNRNKLYAEKLAAKLEADTYRENLNNLLLVAAAQKNAWVADSNKVWSAYSNLKTKQGDMLDKETALYQAQQGLLIALNKYEEDSAATYKLIKDSINDLQYALDWESKKVILAQNVLDDFNENSKANKETWTAKFNEYKKAIDALANTIAEYDVQVADAEAVYSADTLKYSNEKKAIEKPLKEYNDKIGYHTFVLDSKIAKDTAFKLPANSKFSLKQGVIANEKGIKNSELNAELDAILNVIGDDEKNAGKFYYDEKATKSANADIKGFKKDTADLFEALGKKIDGYTAEIDLKNSDINTKTQKLTERKSQTAVETKFNTEKAAFEAAVTDYKAKALAYKWADESTKSEVYETTATKVAEAIVAFNIAYATEEGEATPDVKKAALTTLRKAIVTAANNSDYWNARTAFDGTKRYKDQDDVKYTNFFNWTAFDDAETESKFDKYVLIAFVVGVPEQDHTDATNVNARKNVKATDDAVKNLVNDLLGGNSRSDANDSGAWKAYTDAATKFIGSHDRYVAYSDAEIAKKTDTDLASLGTTGEYNAWLREIAALEKGIADAKSNPEKVTDPADPDYANPGHYKDAGIAQYEELIKEAQEKTAEDVAKKVEKIDSVETKLANSALWKELYDDIKEVKDANDDKIKELTIAQQEAYNTKLTSYEATVTADKKKVDDLKLAQNIAKSDSTYKAKAMGAYEKLALKDVDAPSGSTLNGDDIEAEIIVQYAIINLQYNIDQAKEAVATKRVELEKVQNHLADFEAGEYSVAKNNYVKTVNDAQKAVQNAELDYEHATKEYEVALKYYNDILAAVEEAE